MKTKDTFVVLTRYFYDPDQTIESATEALNKARRFIDMAMTTGASKVIVVVDAERDKSKALKKNWPTGALVVGSPVWGYSIPLNIGYFSARPWVSQGAKVLWASMEVIWTIDSIDEMMSHMLPGVLSVGAVLEEQQYVPGFYYDANALQVPWHTFELENAKDFTWSIGVPLIGTGAPGHPDEGGSEELIKWTYLQRNFKSVLSLDNLKLVPISGVEWHQKFFVGERAFLHDPRTAKRIERAKMHLRYCHFRKGPSVLHVV
jgi:hypothetical protein